ncbi:hypothetical protein BDZ91DRAFT_789717 [Kalaharituber pfeilii]|nr:hypothetical protein BDZ91DRAFT_789717 [Kalaharituber pfeilii]
MSIMNIRTVGIALQEADYFLTGGGAEKEIHSEPPVANTSTGAKKCQRERTDPPPDTKDWFQKFLEEDSRRFESRYGSPSTPPPKMGLQPSLHRALGGAVSGEHPHPPPTPTRKRKGKAASPQDLYAFKKRLDDKEATKIASAPSVVTPPPPANSTPTSTQPTPASTPAPTPTRTTNPLRAPKAKSPPYPNNPVPPPEVRHRNTRDSPEEGPRESPKMEGGKKQRPRRNSGDTMAKKKDDASRGGKKDELGGCVPGETNRNRQGEARRKMAQGMPVQVGRRTEIG